MWRTARSCTAPPTGAASQDVTPLHGCRCWSCQDRHGQNGISSDGGCGSPLPAGVPLQPMQRRSAGIPHPLCCRRRTPLPHWEGVQQSGWAGAMCCRQSKNTHQVQKARGSPRAVLCTGCAVPTPPSASGSRPLPAALWLVSCCARRLRQPATRSLVTCCGDATDHTPNLTARSNQWCRQCFGLFMRTHYAAEETRHLTHITHTETNTKMTHFKHSFQKTKFNLNRRKNKSN